MKKKIAESIGKRLLKPPFTLLFLIYLFFIHSHTGIAQPMLITKSLDTTGTISLIEQPIQKDGNEWSTRIGINNNLKELWLEMTSFGNGTKSINGVASSFQESIFGPPSFFSFRLLPPQDKIIYTVKFDQKVETPFDVYASFGKISATINILKILSKMPKIKIGEMELSFDSLDNPVTVIEIYSIARNIKAIDDAASALAVTRDIKKVAEKLSSLLNDESQIKLLKDLLKKFIKPKSFEWRPLDEALDVVLEDIIRKFFTVKNIIALLKNLGDQITLAIQTRGGNKDISMHFALKPSSTSEPIISKSIPLGPYPSGQKYYLRVFNVDDLSKVKINGREILSVGYYKENELDITVNLREGQNSIELTLENTGGGWTYGYTLRQGNNLIWNESCGRVGVEGCRNNDQTRGMVARHMIDLTITTTTPTACTDGAQFVADVTVPENTGMQPAQKFTKTWRLKNTGSCSWGSGYSLVFVGGTQMGAPNSVSVPSVSQNGTGDINVSMVAPSTPGTYQGNWQMRNSKGQTFGPQIWVKINIASVPQTLVYNDLKEWLFKNQNVQLTGNWNIKDCNYWSFLKDCRHTGIDFAAPEGTPVYAATDGIVIRAEPGMDCREDRCLSTVAIYNESTKVTFFYLHMKNIKVKKDDPVKVGDIIGEVGQRGRVTGSHLHFEASPGKSSYASLDVYKTLNPYEEAKKARQTVSLIISDKPPPVVPPKEPIISKSIPIGPYPSGQKYYLRVFNVDDVSKVKINDREILSVGYYKENELDITGNLREGQNSIELTLENTGGGWTYGYTLRQGNNLIWNESCGRVGVEGCKNNDQTRGMVASHSINLSITAKLISTPVPPPITAKIDSFSASPNKIQVGQTTTFKFTFTNTANTLWTFGAGISLRRPDGVCIANLPTQPIRLNPNQQGTATWTYTIDREGSWDVVFGIWKDPAEKELLTQTGWLTRFVVAEATPPKPSLPTSDPNLPLSEQLQQVRMYLERFNYPTEADRRAVIQEFQRAAQALQAIEEAAKRGDRATVQHQIAQAQQAINTVNQLLAQIEQRPAPPKPASTNLPPQARITLRSGTNTTHENQVLQLMIPQGRTTQVTFSGERSVDPEGSALSYQWLINGQIVNTARDFSFSLGRGTHHVLLKVRDSQGLENAVGATANITEQVATPLITTKVDSFSASPNKIQVGQTTTFRVAFTNTGNTSWTFGAGLSLRRPDGVRIDNLPTQPVKLNPNQQGTATWTYTIDREGSWDVVFGIWKDPAEKELLTQTGWLTRFVVAEATPPKPSPPTPVAPDPQLLAQVQQSRALWERLNTQASQISYPTPADQVAVSQELQRAGQALQAAEAAAQRGDRATVQHQIAQAQQALNTVSQRLAQIAQRPTPPKPTPTNLPPQAKITLRSGSSTTYENQVLQVTIPPGTTTQVIFSGERSADPEGSPLTYQWFINGQQVHTARDFSFSLGRGTHQILLKVRDSQGLESAVGATVNVTDQVAAPPPPTPPVQPPIAVKPPPPPPPSGSQILTVTNTGGFGLKLRANPSLNASVIANLSEGTRMTVVGGPTQGDGYTWWKLSGPVGTGWSAVGNWLTPTPTVGGTVAVMNTGGLGLKLRATASLNAQVIANLSEGSRMTVIGGPTQRDGYTWWNLKGPQGTGWSAVGNWLVH